MFNLGLKLGFEEKMDGTGWTFPRAGSQQSEPVSVLFGYRDCTSQPVNPLCLEKTLEIYKTIKHKDEIFFHPTASVFLPASKAAVIFQFLRGQIFNSK